MRRLYLIKFIFASLIVACINTKHVSHAVPIRYLFLENEFYNDRIRIWTHKSILADTIVSTNQATGNAFTFKFQFENLTIKVNNDTSFYITPVDSNNSVFIITRQNDLKKYFFTKSVDTILVRW